MNTPSSTSCLLLVMRDRYGSPPPLYIASLTCDTRLLFNRQELLWRHAIDGDFRLTTGEPCRERTQQTDHLGRVRILHYL